MTESRKALGPTLANSDAGEGFLVLLGAGASADAGLPMANSLTDCALKAAASYEDEGRSARALNYVVAAMQLWDVRFGRALSDGIGIERLVSAVELLANRSSLEVAPFIYSWDGSVAGQEESAAYVDDYNAQRFFEALQTPLDTRGWSGQRGFQFSIQREAMQKVFWQLTHKRQHNTFELLHAWLVRQVVQDLSIQDPEAIEYFVPLVRSIAESPNASIATLNYDLCVELALEKASLPTNRYVAHWADRGSLDTPSEGDVNLLKLHGSIDWLMTPEEDFVAGTTPEGYSDWKPALIYGQREKLRVGGPFLQLFEKFRANLVQTNRLIVVGYSFSDAHINTVIRRWLRTNARARLLICDPFFPEVSPSSFSGNEPERVLLWRKYGPEPSVNPLYPTTANSAVTVPKLAISRSPADDFFSELAAQGVDNLFAKAGL